MLLPRFLADDPLTPRKNMPSMAKMRRGDADSDSDANAEWLGPRFQGDRTVPSDLRPYPNEIFEALPQCIKVSIGWQIIGVEQIAKRSRLKVSVNVIKDRKNV